MQRDPELIRSILLSIEGAGELIRQPTLPEYERRTVHLHIRLLIEAGYVLTTEASRTISQDWMFLRLSWTGYDFLDHVRDSGIWHKTKEAAFRVGSWSLDTLGAIARQFVVAKAESLGIAIAL